MSQATYYLIWPIVLIAIFSHEFGGDHVMLIDGYNQFFKFRPVSHVHYNVAVTKLERIEDEDTDCVRVSYEFTAEVSEHEQRRVAQALKPAFDAVIVTSSLGVLKRKYVLLFYCLLYIILMSDTHRS